MAAKTAADAAANLRPETLLVLGLLGFVVISGFGKRITDAVDSVVDVAGDVGKGVGDFGTGVWNGAENEYIYSLDQSGSPNPPIQDFWNAYGDGYLDDSSFEVPVAVQIGYQVPTPPVFEIIEPSRAEKAGGFFNDLFAAPSLKDLNLAFGGFF